jgi:hypothetical protein
MSQDLINQITLNCLMNKHQYEKYVTSKISKSINDDDKKIYKKRIIFLTKELLSNSNNEEKENTIAPDVKYAFEQYIKSCIQYFKLVDNNDVIQEKYKDLDIVKENNDIEEEEKEDNQEKDKLIQDEEELEKNNSLWVRSIKMYNPSLDSFINKKQEY